jgi:surface polysaccharide O-acyltransferase-like enzyme
LLADHLVRRRPPEGRLWRGVRTASRASFGVYLAHMLPLQLLLLTPLAALAGLSALPLPIQAPVVLAVVLAATAALVAALQRTALSVVLTGRPRRARPAPRTVPDGRAAPSPARPAP